MIFPSFAAASAQAPIHFEKSFHIMAKIWQKNNEKPSSPGLKPISLWYFQNRKPKFQLPDSSLVSIEQSAFTIEIAAKRHHQIYLAVLVYT